MAEPDRAPTEPLIGVGIPTYNRAGKLARAVESVLGQTHRHLELVISESRHVHSVARACAPEGDAGRGSASCRMRKRDSAPPA